jgi:hypothetical protein
LTRRRKDILRKSVEAESFQSDFSKVGRRGVGGSIPSLATLQLHVSLTFGS